MKTKDILFSGIAARGPRKGREIIGNGYFKTEDGIEYIFTKICGDTRKVFHRIRPGTAEIVSDGLEN